MRDSKSSNFSHIEDIQIVARVLEGNTEAFLFAGTATP